MQNVQLKHLSWQKESAPRTHRQSAPGAAQLAHPLRPRRALANATSSRAMSSTVPHRGSWVSNIGPAIGDGGAHRRPGRGGRTPATRRESFGCHQRSPGTQTEPVLGGVRYHCCLYTVEGNRRLWAPREAAGSVWTGLDNCCSSGVSRPAVVTFPRARDR